MVDLNIRYNPNQQIFFTPLENKLAFIKFERPGKEVIEFTHTFVPEEYRHKGIASELAKHVLEHAKENDLRVRPSCPFVENYMEDHPKYLRILEEGYEKVTHNR